MCGGGVIAASHQAYSICSKPRTTSITCQRCCREKAAGFWCKNESRTILDAFFLGKALAETLNERIESSVGEFLSIVGRLQAEQQKQMQEFQDEVLEKAKRAKEQAAREAVETQRIISKFSAADVSRVDDGVAKTTYSNTPKINRTLAASTEDPVLGMLKDD